MVLLHNLYNALLAQLVARGSDKAKVIGSSPVESKRLSLFFLVLIHFLFILQINKKNACDPFKNPVHKKKNPVIIMLAVLSLRQHIRLDIGTAGCAFLVYRRSGVQILEILHSVYSHDNPRHRETDSGYTKFIS